VHLSLPAARSLLPFEGETLGRTAGEAGRPALDAHLLASVINGTHC